LNRSEKIFRRKNSRKILSEYGNIVVNTVLLKELGLIVFKGQSFPD